MEAQRRAGQREKAMARRHMQGDEGAELKCKATQETVAPSAPKEPDPHVAPRNYERGMSVESEEDDATADGVVRRLALCLAMAVEREMNLRESLREEADEPQARVAADADAGAGAALLTLTLTVRVS